MLREDEVLELPVVGGDLALDFANTVDDPSGPERHDYIASLGGLLSWAEHMDLLDPAAHQRLARRLRRNDGGQQLLDQAHALRVVLNDVFTAVVMDRPVDEPWRRLRPFVVDATAAVSLHGSPPTRHWDPLGRGGSILHPVASAAADLLTSPELERLKRCARCPWLFLDTSKNHSRRWCTMDACGRAQKIERYVAKRSAARSAMS